MKKLLKVWMYICTFLFSAHLLIVVTLLVWAQFQVKNPSYTTPSGEKIELSPRVETEPEILDLFAAVEANDLKTIYQYAAPEG